ncbi:MAG: sensor histidine kinase [Sulfurovaceae bacterium]|nr:sensor histidine kinase [Sulfurovaceae bacterium]
MYSDEENLFKLQVFQQSLSTLYMYPLRIYKNNCYEHFYNEISHNGDLQKLYTLLMPNEPFLNEPHQLIKKLKKEIKENPKKINEESEIYKILNNHSEKLRDYMWETNPSNSLTFVREVKSSRRLWLFLMIYDLFSKDFIDNNFKKPYQVKCLIDMQSIYIQLNKTYTLSIGRLFTEKKTNTIVENIIKNYNFENMNIFELTTLSKKRRTSDIDRVESKAKKIKKAFQRFFEIQTKIPTDTYKEEIQEISIFIYMVTSQEFMNKQQTIKTKNFILIHNEEYLSIKKHNESSDYTLSFIDIQRKFENNKDFFRAEYASRLKSTLSKRYSGLVDDKLYSPIKELLKHICSELNADGACYIRYNLSNDSLNVVTKHGDTEYKKGISRLVNKINQKEIDGKNRSRVLEVIANYYSGSFDMDKLILKNLEQNKILQPVKGKPILSNIALPVTFKHKLLGVLIIDSFRVGKFTEHDINMIVSITTALSVQIYDQVVEENLSAIMENLPQKPTLDDLDIQRQFKNLTTYINNIFFSYGVDIWSYNENYKAFNLKSTTLNIQNLSDYIIKKEDDNLIFKLLDQVNNKEDNYLSCLDIKNSNHLSICNPSEKDPRINCARIYPIYNEERLIGAFSIYNSSQEDYRSIDILSLKSVTKHLIIFFNIMNTIKEQRALVQSQALHEISAKFNMLDDKTKQLRELLNLNFKELDHYTRYRFNIKLNDINSLTRNTRLAFDYIANKSDSIKHNNHVDEEIEGLYKPEQKNNREVNNIRHIFNELTNSIPYPYKNKNIRINNMLDERINLRVHSLLLQDIFLNMLLNAVKYSFQGTTIRIFSKVTSNNVYINIKNDGLEIKEGEEIDIFRFGYRGFYSKEYSEEIDGEEINYKSKDDENLGIGLYKSNQIVKKILSGQIHLKTEESKFNNATVNTFEISIPITLQDKGDKK